MCPPRSPPATAGRLARRRSHRAPGPARCRARRQPRARRGPRPALLHVHLPDQRQVREGGARQRQAGQGDPADPGAKLQVRCGFISERASSACVTPSGRSASSVRACTISAREGRTASGRRSTTRTTAPWSWACKARARPGRARAEPGCRPAPRCDAGQVPPPGRGAGQFLRLGQQVAAAQRGQHDVVDRAPHRHQREHPPQGPGVVFREPRAIPLIQPRYRPRSSSASHSFDTRPGKAANSGVLSRLSRRNTACPRPRTARSRNSTTSTHRIERRAPVDCVSPGTLAPRCRRRSAAASPPGPSAGAPDAAAAAARCPRSSRPTPAAWPGEPGWRSRTRPPHSPTTLIEPSMFCSLPAAEYQTSYGPGATVARGNG